MVSALEYQSRGRVQIHARQKDPLRNAPPVPSSELDLSCYQAVLLWCCRVVMLSCCDVTVAMLSCCPIGPVVILSCCLVAGAVVVWTVTNVPSTSTQWSRHLTSDRTSNMSTSAANSPVSWQCLGPSNNANYQPWLPTTHSLPHPTFLPRTVSHLSSWLPKSRAISTKRKVNRGTVSSMWVSATGYYFLSTSIALSMGFFSSVRGCCRQYADTVLSMRILLCGNWFRWLFPIQVYFYFRLLGTVSGR